MTIEEMRNAIKDYCLSTDDCDNCPIDEIVRANNENCWNQPTKEMMKAGVKLPNIERNYAIIYPEKADNLYWERVNALAVRQRVKGMSKYGVGLESNPAAILERIEHLQEELIDGLMYCEWIKDRLKELED